MKYLKKFGLGALAAMALTGLAVPSAAATTLEVGGTAQNASVVIEASTVAGTSAVLSRTDGALANTCTTSYLSSWSVVYTNYQVTSPVGFLTFNSCERPVTVHKPGQIYIEHESGTTNGLVFSEFTEVTVSTPFATVNCRTGIGTKIGTLTGVASGSATIDINAVLDCGFLLPSASWKGSYTVTSPTGLGVVA